MHFSDPPPPPPCLLGPPLSIRDLRVMFHCVFVLTEISISFLEIVSDPEVHQFESFQDFLLRWQ